MSSSTVPQQKSAAHCPPKLMYKLIIAAVCRDSSSCLLPSYFLSNEVYVSLWNTTTIIRRHLIKEVCGEPCISLQIGCFDTSSSEKNGFVWKPDTQYNFWFLPRDLISLLTPQTLKIREIPCSWQPRQWSSPRAQQPSPAWPAGGGRVHTPAGQQVAYTWPAPQLGLFTSDKHLYSYSLYFKLAQQQIGLMAV